MKKQIVLSLAGLMAFFAVGCGAIVGGDTMMEKALKPNEQQPLRWDTLDINGTRIAAEGRRMLPPDFFFSLLGEPEETIHLPYEKAYPYMGEDFTEYPALLRFDGNNEMRVRMDRTCREFPVNINTICLTGMPDVSLCGVRIGDPAASVLQRFSVEETREVTYEGQEVTALYGGPEENLFAYVVMDGDTPDYVCYQADMEVIYDFDEKGNVEEIRCSFWDHNAERYEEPALLYPYARDPSETTFEGNLQMDALRPSYQNNAYISFGSGACYVHYLLPKLYEGESYPYDYTAMMQDVAFLMGTWEAVERVQFVFHSPEFGYTNTVEITRPMLELALGAPLSEYRSKWRETATVRGETVSFEAFDKVVRKISWQPDLAKSISYEELSQGAGKWLSKNSQPEPWRMTFNGLDLSYAVQAMTVNSWFGLPVATEDTPAYDGAEMYLTNTYANGSKIGGWNQKMLSGKRSPDFYAGALYLTGDTRSNVNGIRLGDSVERVVRSFRVEEPYETSLPAYDVEDAVVLYGDVVHMGSYGYLVRENGRYTAACYGIADQGVLTFFFDEKECVSAIRCQMEDHIRFDHPEN